MKNQERKLEETRAYNKSEKGKAAQALRDAVRRGDIQRQPCEVCGEPDAQGHHEDYGKPLEVKWLCAKHHREEHLYEPWQNELRRAGYAGGFLLGELIAACGENFKSVERVLSKDGSSWWIATAYFPSSINGALASGTSFTKEQAAEAATFLRKGGTVWVPNGDVNTAWKRVCGRSVESAVANLWLALNPPSTMNK